MTNEELTLAAIGCTGHVADIFVDGFLKQGIKTRLLARNPENMSSRYPAAEVIKGNMMNPTDAARAMQGVDAAFLVTPMGVRNDPTLEPKAVIAALEGARAAKLPHLIFVSAIGLINQPGLVSSMQNTKRSESWPVAACRGRPSVAVLHGGRVQSSVIRHQPRIFSISGE